MSVAYSVGFIDEFVTGETDCEILGEEIRFGDSCHISGDSDGSASFF